MGRVGGRDAALTPALAATLAMLAEAMTGAERPWWVIGGAAAVLHGVETIARDVDVVLAVEDVEAIADRVRAVALPRDDHPLFRSKRVMRWDAPPTRVEFMAGFRYRAADGWRPVWPVTRERIDVAGQAVFVPSREEVRDLMLAFGRPKDLARAASLG